MRQSNASEMEDERDSSTESLLDLPLRGEAEPTAERPADSAPESSSPSRSLLFDPPVEVEVSRPQPVPAAAPDHARRFAPGVRALASGGLAQALGRSRGAHRGAAPATDPQAAPLLSRLKGGLADVAVHLAVIGLLAVGVRLLGARLTGEAGSVLVMVLAFSFLYTIPALLVWGRTPGAAVAGLAVRNPDGGTPTASQAARRWLAQWVTWLLAGLPGLIRLADRWSGTQTVVR